MCFRYISEPLGLIRYLCEIHMTGILPSAIIVEDFFYYVSHHQVTMHYVLLKDLDYFLAQSII